MPYDFPLFFRGDIADVVDSIPVTDKNINNIRKTLLTAKPFKVIILRQLDNRLYLVAVCKEAAGKTNLKVDTNKYPLYVKVLSFYSIDECSLRLCRDIYPNKNKCLVVAEIYDLHNKLIEKRKSEQREKRRKEWEKVQKSKKLRIAKKEKQKVKNQEKNHKA